MKTKCISSLAIILALLTVFAGCDKTWRRIEGNGQVVTELRTLPPFDEIINEGEFHVYLEQDSVFEVFIEAESNLIPHIRTRINGAKLEIDTRENLREHYPMMLYIKTPHVNGIFLNGSGIIVGQDMIITDNLDLGISGSGNIDLDVDASEEVRVGITGSGTADMTIFCEDLLATISGSGDMFLAGTANRGEYRISGSGTVRAQSLYLQECYARISGSGSMYVTVEQYLDAVISGSGSIYYYGNPSVNTSISGSGSVIKP